MIPVATTAISLHTYKAQEVNSNGGVAADADAAVVELSIAEQWANAEKAARFRTGAPGPIGSTSQTSPIQHKFGFRIFF